MRALLRKRIQDDADVHRLHAPQRQRHGLLRHRFMGRRRGRRHARRLRDRGLRGGLGRRHLQGQHPTLHHPALQGDQRRRRLRRGGDTPQHPHVPIDRHVLHHLRRDALQLHGGGQRRDRRQRHQYQEQVQLHRLGQHHQRAAIRAERPPEPQVRGRRRLPPARRFAGDRRRRRHLLDRGIRGIDRPRGQRPRPGQRHRPWLLRGHGR